ncbi:MAG: DUF481 domain-containing protein [Parvularculaceae bacterium]|nr:DUF481 domain-containing protein [Parvularculaceae bacterium]
MNRFILAGCVSIVAAPSFAEEAETPTGLAAALIEAAAQTGDASQISAVANAAREVFADDADAIDAFAAAKIAALVPPETTPGPNSETAPDMTAAAEAEIPAAAPERKSASWSGKMAASAVLANGNSENMAVGLLLDARRENGQLAHNIDGYIDYGRSDGVQNLKRWGGAYQLDYKFSDRAFAYGRISYDEDQFSGFDYRLFAGAGAGYFLAQSDMLKWKIEGGPGYQYSPVDDTRQVQKELALYGGTELDWTIREGLIFEQDVKIVWTEPTTTIVSLTGLSAALTEKLAAGIAYEYRYETSPPPGRKNTDTVFKANISLGF